MYPDPKKVKDNRYTFRLDDYEDEKLHKLIAITNEQPAALIRELLMLGVDAELSKLDKEIMGQSTPDWKSPKGCKLSATNSWRFLCLNI